MNIIEKLEQEEIARLGKTVPVFAPGDTVIVNVTVVEGERKRTQAYEGVVIAKRNRGLNSSFVVRKISSGEGVERTFQTYSPLLSSIEVKRRGDVRRAKLYYLRDRSGKSARIREKLTAKAPKAADRPSHRHAATARVADRRSKGSLRAALLWFLRRLAGHCACAARREPPGVSFGAARRVGGRCDPRVPPRDLTVAGITPSRYSYDIGIISLAS